MARSFYQEQLAFIAAPSANWFAAAIFYLLFIVGILFFVVVLGLESNSLKATLLRAALFGLTTYATQQDWPVLLTVVNLILGTVLSV